MRRVSPDQSHINTETEISGLEKLSEAGRDGGAGVSGPAGDLCPLLAPQVLQDPWLLKQGCREKGWGWPLFGWGLWTSWGLTLGTDAQEHWEGAESDPESSTGQPS